MIVPSPEYNGNKNGSLRPVASINNLVVGKMSLTGQLLNEKKFFLLRLLK
jgi:hypothetical protein